MDKTYGDKFVTDYSDASGTNALDLENLKWSVEILAASGIDMDKLPGLHVSTDIIENLKPDAADICQRDAAFVISSVPLTIDILN